ncbi:MAG: hypothetical protein MJZ15_10365 [Bacteroidales bacterium]|nr:hypothetical protein [Bacteroidales bacterium]
MKSLNITIAIALTLIVGALVFNSLNGSDNVNMAEFNIDLNQNENLCDLVFDKDGHLITGTTYKWNNVTDTRGEVISALTK